MTYFLRIILVLEKDFRNLDFALDKESFAFAKTLPEEFEILDWNIYYGREEIFALGALLKKANLEIPEINSDSDPIGDDTAHMTPTMSYESFYEDPCAVAAMDKWTLLPLVGPYQDCHTILINWF